MRALAGVLTQWDWDERLRDENTPLWKGAADLNLHKEALQSVIRKSELVALKAGVEQVWEEHALSQMRA
jgi:hypothetical protein